MNGKRTFTDRTGMRWKVSEVQPAQGVAPLLERRKFPRSQRPGAPPQLATREQPMPWLRFESSADCRRVNVVPPDWETLTDAALEDLLATSVRLSA